MMGLGQGTSICTMDMLGIRLLNYQKGKQTTEKGDSLKKRNYLAGFVQGDSYDV